MVILKTFKEGEFDEFTRKRSKIIGYSLPELLAAVMIIGLVTTISLPYFFNYRRVYKSDEQARTVMDLMRETGQLALTRRRTYRFEIDLTDGRYLIIDENAPGAADDTEIKSVALEPTTDIRLDTAPTGVSRPAPPNYNNAVFANDALGHLKNNLRVSNNRVWAARFTSNGSVINAAGNPLSATLFIWSPRSPGNNAARELGEVRAITLFGGSGAVRYWRYDGTQFSAY